MEDDVVQAVQSSSRLRALAESRLLDSPPEPAFDRLTRLARRFLDADVTLVSLVDADRQFYKSSSGRDDSWSAERERPLSYSFCKYVVATGRPFVVEDAQSNPLVRLSPAVRELGVRAYAGVPLRWSDGEVLGSFCAVAHSPREWTQADLEVLADLAESARTELQLRQELRVRYAAEARLAEAVSRAEGANAAKSDFLTRMSHELRTPLNSVIGFTNLLLKRLGGRIDEGERVYLERIGANGKHLLELINEVLDLAKVEAGKMEVQLEQVDLRQLVESTVAEMQPRRHSDDVILRATVPPALEPVKADALRLKQVVINLIGNALKFTESGVVEVVVSARPDGRPAQLDVRDSGIGIPPERLGAIFEPFTQAESGTARKFGGTGLGLALSRGLCDLMGFRLQALSTEDVGSTFSVVFCDPVG